jgi:hypothetical protein
MEEQGFTHEELVGLAKAGKLNFDTVRKLPKELQGQGLMAINEAKFGEPQLMGPGGGGSAPVQGLMGAVKETAKVLVPAGVQAAASLSGHPFIGMGLATALSRGMGRMGSGRAPKLPSSPPAQFSGTGAEIGPVKATNTGASQTGAGWSMPGGPKPAGPPAAPKLPEFAPEHFPTGARNAPPLPGFAGEVKPTPRNVTKSPATGYSGLNAEEAMEQVKRGIQHDFKGRVSFQKGKGPSRPEFPPGASSKTPPSIYRTLEEEFAEQAGNPAEVEAIRQFIAKALSGGK